MVSTPGTVWLCIRLSYSQVCSLSQFRPLKTGFATSKAKAMDPEIARDQNYDDHYANDSEDVHSALLPFHDDSARRARSPYVSAAIKLLASFRHRWLGSTEASKYKSFLSPPPISPIAAPSEEQKDHEDNKNEIHSFLQNFWRGISLLHMWVQNNYSPASDSTYYYFNGAVMRLSTFRVCRSRPRPDTVASAHGTYVHGRSM
jgi:hypothetical protein